MLTSQQIRQQYIDFFVKQHAHAFVASSPVVPHADPTLLFTNAGMNQFKPYFLGTEKAPWKRVANTQKCIRAGGKHNDLDDVGRSRRHHTFFEMLGNWSFGDYFKQGAIEMAWELLTKVWKLDPSRLHVSCFEGDEKNGVPRDTEAADIWKNSCGVAEDHIHYFGKDNFWEMGDTGPCGPCTEIYIDRTPGKTGGKDVNGEDPRVMEIWNLVFIQYNRNADRSLTTLPAQHVDTGMGLERIIQVLQDKSDNFGIDLWAPLFDAISKLSGQKYTGQFTATNSVDPAAEAANPQLRTDIAFRVIADHARCLTFALTDGAVPSNEGRGYVLRRILRRAVRFGRQQLGLNDPFMFQLVPIIGQTMGDTFPELRKDPQRVMDLVKDEEESFGRTLDRGIALFSEAAQRASAKVVSAQDAFKLHDTYGFPIDLTEVMAAERGMTVDIAGYHQLMEQAKELARGGADEANIHGQLVEIVQQNQFPATQFMGYAHTQWDTVTWLKHFRVGNLTAVVTGATPFYGEAGGQVGDVGSLSSGSGTLTVTDTHKIGDVIIHLGTLQGDLPQGDRVEVNFAVDKTRRDRIMANHTTTHVMNHKLRAVLGEHVQQKGSLVDDEKLRFDFSHNAAVTAEQIEQVEQLVNADIAADLPVYWEVAPQQDAMKIHGLRAVFGEKYPPKVRVVSIGVPLKDLLDNPGNTEWQNYSVEFCGGTHLSKTGDAEGFTVIAEEAVGKGLRRLTALTGEAAHSATARGEMLLARLQTLKSAPADKLAAAVTDLTAQIGQTTLSSLHRAKLREGITELQKLVKEQQKAQDKQGAEAVVEQARAIAEQQDGSLIVAALDNASADALRTAMDVIKKKKPEAALLLGSVSGDKVSFIAVVPPALVAKGLKAGDWVREVAKAAGGGGGGRPDMAQAGGKDPAKLNDALEVGRAFAMAKC
jgi:alanyl-tRNA synthetase